MTSWSRLWPLLVIPYLALLGLGILPAGEFFGRSWGGAYVREWLLNEAVLPWLPSDAAWQLVRWFKGAHWGQEMLLYGLIVLNLYVFLILPVLMGLAQGLIRFSAWSMAADLAQKRAYFRR